MNIIGKYSFNIYQTDKKDYLHKYKVKMLQINGRDFCLTAETMVNNIL